MHRDRTARTLRTRVCLLDAVPQNRAGAVTLPLTALGTGDFAVAVTDYYLTNPIARASALMAELGRLDAARAPAPMAAE